MNMEGIISFYPQSEEVIKAKEFGGVPLWEMPWVTGHEYGHHIFRTIFPYYDKFGTKLDEKTSYKHHNCWLHNGERHEDLTNSHKEIYKLKKLKLLKALNEGFSDLFSFYAIKQK